jgi:signal transduction histidine kinase
MRDDSPAHGREVLIVDGDCPFAQSVASRLAAQGYQTAIASPKDMLAALRQFRAPLVLCGIDGADAAGANLPGQLMAARPDLACIVMANRADQRRAGSRLNGGVSDYIDKSRGLEELVAIVDNCFHRRELHATTANGHEALKSAEEAVDQANRARVEFLAKVSHELRTPLNAIIGFSELMMHGVLGPLGNEQYRDYVEDIHASGRHLLDIINDILDFAKAEAGKLLLLESDVNVHQVAVALERLVGPRARDAGLVLNNRVPPDLPKLSCDERKLKQMLLNLLTNAVKFTPSGGTVDIEAGCGADGIVLGVRDTGVGIDKSDLNRVLQPFVQVENTLNRRQEGTGLGLALVKAMVELHDGRINLESEVGGGTLVQLIFPPERAIAQAKDSSLVAPYPKRLMH